MSVWEIQELYLWLHLKQKHRHSLDIEDPQFILSGSLLPRVKSSLSFREGYEELQNRQVPNQQLTKSSSSKPFTKRGSLMLFCEQVNLR